jgi:hypothetical protein
MDRPLDYIGRPIRVGDEIVWAAQRGDSPCLSRGSVQRGVRNTKETTWSDKVEVGYKIKVRRKANDEFEQDGRLVTLSFPNRILVISLL